MKQVQLINRYRIPIMGFLTLWIWYTHCWEIVFWGWKLFEIEWTLKWTATISVDAFFFLSGIGLTYGIKKHDLKEFYKRRFRRIGFPYLFRGVVQGIINRWTIGQFLFMVSGAAMFTCSVLAFLWFGTAIAIFYLLFPLYYYFFDKSKNKLFFTICAILIWFALAFGFRNIIRGDLYDFINRIPVFLIGILFGYYIQNGLNLNSPKALLISIPVFAVGYYLEYITTFNHTYILLPSSRFFLPGVLCGPTMPIILSFILFGLDKLTLTSWIVKILGCFGIISFEMFCVSQGFFDNILLMWFGDKVPTLLYNFISLFICTLSAILLYYLGKYFWKLIDWIKLKISASTKNETP